MNPFSRALSTPSAISAAKTLLCGMGLPFIIVSLCRCTLADPAPAARRLVFMIGEDEYKTWETLPEFARTELEPRGYHVTVIQQDDKDKNHFPGLVEALSNADLLLVSVRRRLPPKAEMDAVRAHLEAGKPMIGIRTACHAFAPLRSKKGSPPAQLPGQGWPEFDPQVLGGHYTDHWPAGPKVAVTLAPEATGSPLLEGVEVNQLTGNGSLYEINSLDPDCKPLLIGTIPDKPPEPLAWTHLYGPKSARVFYTQLGHPDDFKEPAFRRLLLNGITWALAPPPPGPPPAPAPAGQRALLRSDTVPSLNVADNLRIDMVLKEPVVANPLYINFDERGRLWVVQYRQYPWPAGLALRSHDAVWRNVYDPAFPPPPPFDGNRAPFLGHDRITIHQSTHHDGVFDKTTVFLDGLNLATAALKGRGGVFVLEAPYLLFYPCKDNADRPDSQTPQVLLSGFGIEDTHSVANSLRWGPDGWIYGAQGSTVSAAIVRYGQDGKPVPGEKPLRIMGQNIWRYQPETRRFEIFAEGGGNTFGVDFDSKGRLFSGHNGGDTRGFHYIQGGYYLKGFEKHGALSNPYTFGYIHAMEHAKVDRFTHTFAIYDAEAFPAPYRGKMFAIAPHRHYVICTDMLPEGSTFKTQDISKVVTAGTEPRDDWFTPVDIQLGPDGALYIADFYKAQANHYRSSQGQTDPSLGRIYRLAGKDTPPVQAFDLGILSSEELVSQYLGHPNRWYREQALRLLGDRKDRTLIPMLARMVREKTGSLALNALWALNLSGGFDDAFALEAISHGDPCVRAWAVRLIGDNNAAPTSIASALASLAQSERDSGVRSQLACTAKRLSADEALPIIVNLLSHDEDVDDLHIPHMLWWALEAHAADREAVLRMYEEKAVWQSKLLPEGRTLPENLVQRWAMPGTQDDLLACARLLNLSPDAEHSKRLVAAFNRAFEGRPIPALPEPLTEALAKSGGSFATLLGIRRGDPAAIATGFATIADAKATVADRLQVIRAAGDVQADPGKSVPLLLHLATTAREDTLRSGALAALQKFDDVSIGPTVLRAYNGLPPAAQDAAQALLSSRAAWALQLMQAIDAGDIKPRTLQPGTIDKLRLQTDSNLVKLVGRFFPDTHGTNSELDDKIARFKKTILAGGGNPVRGKALFFGKVGCANCHTVFDHGGHVGPDLTSYDRSNLDSMLLAIVNPSAEIREGFEDYIITTQDGRTLDGFKVDENDKVFILRGIDGQNTIIPLDQLKSRRVSPRSIMPEGLLDDLQENELCDLFSFLSSTTPPK